MKSTLIAVSLVFSAVAFAESLEELVVTAQKRSQSIQEVGLSVGILSDDEVNQALLGGADVLALSNRLPSLHIESSNGRLAPRFYIRGMGNIDFDLNASQPVSVVYDDVVLENPAARSFPLFDIAQLELLRGPQGTLFGRNSTGGVFKIESNKPSPYFNSRVAIALGSYDHRRIEAVINAPLSSSTARVRLAVLANRSGNWIDNVAPNFESQNALGGFSDLAFRFLVSITPTAGLDVLLNLHGRKLEGTPTLFRANVISSGTNQLVSNFDYETISLDAFDQHFQKSSQFGFAATATITLANSILFSQTSIHTVPRQISRGDVDGGYGSVFGGVLPSGPEPGIPFDAQTADQLNDLVQFTQEFRLEGMAGTRHWRLGFFAFLEELAIETFNFDTVFVRHRQNGYVHQAQRTSAYALFASWDLYSSEAVTLTSGCRLSTDKREFEAIRSESPLSFLGIGGIGPLRVSPEDTTFTWDLAVTMDVSNEISTYARIATGHRGPAIQGRLLFQDKISVADSEVNHSFEIGLKALTNQGRIRTHVSLYSYLVDNFQLTKIGGSANLSELVNVERLKGSGMELELDLYFNESWSLKAGSSLNFTKIDDPQLSVNGCGSANLLRGCTVTDPQLPNGEFSIHGNSLYNAPETMVNLSIKYIRPLAIGRFEATTDWMYRSFLRFTLYENIEYSDDRAVEGGLQLSFLSHNKMHRVAIFGRNILADESLIGAVDFNNLTGMLNAPRTVGMEYRFSM